MASPVNRTAIFLNLTAFVGVSVFCISTQAPLIQQDILKRSQDALLMHHIPIEGLTADGRDVVLTGAPEMPITTTRARLMVQELEGVRSARTKFALPVQSQSAPLLPALPAAGSVKSDTVNSVEPANDASHSKPEGQPPDVQAKIDEVLQKQGITFKGETAIIAPEGEAALDKLAAILTASPNLLCDIRGYDNQPHEARQNWVLALQRALSTEDYLTSKGVAIWRMTARAYEAGGLGPDGRRTDLNVDVVVKAK